MSPILLQSLHNDNFNDCMLFFHIGEFNHPFIVEYLEPFWHFDALSNVDINIYKFTCLR